MDDNMGSGCVCLLMAFIVGMFFGGLLAHKAWRVQMVDKGLANYNTYTGKWQLVGEPTIEGESRNENP